MSHLDEGTLHALLDGELDLAEVSEVQAHLGSCVACGSRLQEVKQFLAEADRLVGALEVPASAAARTDEMPSRTRSPRESPPPLAGPFHEPDPWESPVILLPEATDTLAGRRRWFRIFRWAALIAVVVGGGRMLVNAIHPGSSLPRDRDITMATRSVGPAVASSEETKLPAHPVTPPPNRPVRTPVQNRGLTAKTAPQPKAAAAEALLDTASPPADTFADQLADSAPADNETLAAGSTAESVSTDSLARDSAATRGDAPPQSDDLATRRAAAQALAELDRERRRERAAAATAALQPSTPVRAESPPAAEAPPPPRTPEQRAQVYLRVGLDEAAKQLGGPVHVIEGMNPEFIGLTYGRLVAGADPNRPVVRVVYVDARGRMILLDQQRMRPTQAPGAAEGNLRWSVGDVMLYLRGEPGPDVLRNLQRRVR